MLLKIQRKLQTTMKLWGKLHGFKYLILHFLLIYSFLLTYKQVFELWPFSYQVPAMSYYHFSSVAYISRQTINA